ncbi:MAG: GAF domain-containing protein [Anaerolineae bacterium]|nr:GAF domain-containing protein [Anaerolineae bacterium]
MNLLDMRTIILSHVISNTICATVITFLWIQNRKHFTGLGFWSAGFVTQLVAVVLIALRGTVPDFISIVISNTLLIVGVLLLYVGLERFMGKRSPQIHNVVLLVVFILVHTYFAIIQPDLAARNINVSLGLLMSCSQIAWLMLYRADIETRPITRGVGIVMVVFCTVSAARIVVELVVPPGDDFFHSNIFETVTILTYQMAFIVLTFSLTLTVNRRLFADLEGDMTRRQQVENALALSEEKFSKAFHSSPDAILISRLSDGTLVEVNEGFCRLTGYSREEALSSSAINLGIWDNLKDREQVVADLLKNQRIHDHEYSFRTKAGRLLHCLYSGEIIDLSGEAHILSVVRDISERKRAEDVVRLRLRLVEYAEDHTVGDLMQKALDEIGELTDSPIGFFHVVEEDQNTLLLQAWSTRTLQEFCRAEGKGLHYNVADAGVWVDCIHQRKPIIHNNYAELPHRKGLPDGHAEVVRELVVPTMRDDRVVSVLGVGNKPLDYSEKDVELVAYVADIVWTIVERKRAEELLRQTNDELLARNEELDAFGHTVAHDLKNPLNIIITFAYLLADRESPLSEKEMRQGYQTIMQMGLKMDNIIEELMLLAGLRKADVEMAPLDMTPITAEIQTRLAHQIEESQAEIAWPASWPEAIGYAPWVEEVWFNYISNAIKYGGHPPRIKLGATQEGDTIRFWVHDNGPGLTPEQQERLFAPFERLEQSRLSGHGLGLSIVRRIVERMDGQVEVKSAGEAGEGSIFSFILPASISPP